MQSLQMKMNLADENMSTADHKSTSDIAKGSASDLPEARELEDIQEE